MLDVINIIVDNNINFNFILDNFDTIVNKNEFNRNFNNLPSNVKCIVGVRELKNITYQKVFNIM